MEIKINNLPDWTIIMDEVSAGIYVVQARHTRGPKIELTGEDPDELLECIKKAAEQMEATLPGKSHASFPQS